MAALEQLLPDTAVRGIALVVKPDVARAQTESDIPRHRV